MPTSVLRATQLHEFVSQIRDNWGLQDGAWWVPDWHVQPVAAAAMGRVLAELALAQDPPALSEVAGPQQERLIDMAIRLAAHRRESVPIKPLPDDTPDGHLFAAGGLLPRPGATLTGPTFQDWLNSREGEL